MTNRNFRHSQRRAARVRGMILACGAVALLFAVVACRTVNRAVVVLPNVPGAEYVGSEACAECHSEISRDFTTADHARLLAEGPNALQVGCESCHGPSSLHAQGGGDPKPPYSFSAGRPQTTSFGAMSVVEPARAVEKVCFQCHGNVQGQFNLPSHHPLPEGQLSCVDCHSPHKGGTHVRGGAALLAQNESCLRCHAGQRGPHTFEHEALGEGCVACHAPHGSVNAKLLTARDANLCMKCHFQQSSGGRLLIGGADHTVRVQQGTCWTAGCHEAVHGSRVSSSLRF